MKHKTQILFWKHSAGLDWVDFRWMKDDSATCYVMRKIVSLVWSKWHLQHSYGHKIVMNINTLPEHQNMPKGRRCPQNRTNNRKLSKRPLTPWSRWHDLIRSDNHQSAVISSDDDQIAPDDDPFLEIWWRRRRLLCNKEPFPIQLWSLIEVDLRKGLTITFTAWTLFNTGSSL